MKTIKQKNIFFISIIILSTLFISSITEAKVEAVLGVLPLNENPNLAFKIPTTNESEIILSREQYVLSYNKNKRVPNWVAWKLEPSDFGNSGRTNNFSIDNELQKYISKYSPTSPNAVDQTEYKGSCFDRGHQIPSADRTDTKADNEATFLMSNTTPQTPFLNRISWAHLEQYTRDLVQQYSKHVYVIAGSIFDERYGYIGPRKDIEVPSKEFKIIYILDNNQTPADINSETEIIAVVMPNTLKDGSNPNTNKTELCKQQPTGPNDKNDWMKYKTTIDEIEKLSGLSFEKER